MDASAVIELLTDGDLAQVIDHSLTSVKDSMIAPYLLDVEVASSLRRMTALKRIDTGRAQFFLHQLDKFPVTRYPHVPLLPRIWELRNNFSCYDATYIALAETTHSVLYTADTKLKSGHKAQVVLFSR